MQIVVCDEALDLVDGHGLVHAAAGALGLAALVADAAADGGQRVLLLDELQRLGIAALGGQLQIALHGDVRGAGGLAGSGAGLGHVLVVLAVVHIPGVLADEGLAELGVLALLERGLGAELLAELEGVGRAVFHALAAGHALGLVHLGHVVGADHVPRAEHQTHAQAEAGAGAAVADRGALAGLFDIGHVVHEAVFLGPLDDLPGFLVGDLPGAAGADVVLGALAHLHAHILVQVAAAVAQRAAGGAAGAGGHGEGVVLVQIVGHLVEVLRVGDVLDRALHRHHAHQTVAVREDRRHVLHADAGVLLKGAADLGVLLQEGLVVDQHLHDAGGEDLHVEAVLAVGPVLRDAEHADPGQMLGQLLHLFHALADLLGQILGGAFLAQTRRDGDVGLVVGQDPGQGIVFGGVFVDFVHHARQAADHLAELDDFRSQFSHSTLSVF